MHDVIDAGDMEQLGTDDVVIGRRDSPQQAARGFLRVPESAFYVLLWVLVVASVLAPWGLLLWWLSGALVGI